MKKPLALSLVFAAALAVLVYVGLVERSIPVLRLTQLRSAEYAGGTVQVDGGEIAAIESYAPLLFTVRPEGDPSFLLRVRSERLAPENFKEGIKVSLRGEYDPEEDVFVAYKVSTQCPSRYEASGEGGSDGTPAGPSGAGRRGAPRGEGGEGRTAP